MFTSPTLMAVGAGLVSLPIIIHLLNRRRFKRVDWAAMDFLLEASRINRRRIQLQDLLLLLMRCLAVLLIGALVARPFFTQDAGGDLRSGRFERVVILDDSPSMDSVDKGETPFSRAKDQLESLLESLAEDTSENSLTLYLTSAPDAPVISGEPIDMESLATRLDAVRSLEVSDVPADYRRVLESVERSVARARQEQNNQLVYVLTDFRKVDWDEAANDDSTGSGDGGGDDESEAGEGDGEGEGGADEAIDDGQESLSGVLKDLAPQLSGLYLIAVDVGDTSNILVESVSTDETTIAGVTSRFTVTVRNEGDSEATDLRLLFKAGLSLPVEEKIDSIDANTSRTFQFNYTFTDEEKERRADEFAPDRGVQVRVSVTPTDRAGSDALESDNTFFFPVRVSSGIRTLIVDGEPSSVHGESESFFVKKALSPRGPTQSGLAPEVVTETEFESILLGDYKVIYLLNIQQLSEDMVGRLEKWVDAGGGLCVAVGGSVDEDLYNEVLYKDGNGLSPIRLVEIRGDERRDTTRWASFDLIERRHPILRHFEGQGSLLIEGVKIFRWWNASTDPVAVQSGSTRVLANWIPQTTEVGVELDPDEDLGPAIVERAYGKGKVITITTPIDLDWNDWAQEMPSYVITMQETARYLAEVDVQGGLLTTGEPIRMNLDLTRYKPDYEVNPPKGEKRSRTAIAPAAPIEPAGGGNVAPWKVEDDGTADRGFYEVAFTSNETPNPEIVLFAANVVPGEGKLDQVNTEAVQAAMGDAPVTVVSGTSLKKLGANTAKLEIWRPLLYTLLGLLVLELFYGWWLGVKRGA